MNSVTPGADVPTFRRRWRGYDCTEVDECLSQMIADRRRLQESLARVDALMANSPQDRASAIVGEAKRQAEEIRAQAEQRSRRLTQETTDQAEVLYYERLQASRRELDLVKTLQRDVADCLEASVAALQRARELLSTETAAGAEASPGGPEPVMAATEEDAEPPRAVWFHRRRVYNSLVFASVCGLLIMLLMHPFRERPTPVIPVAAEQQTAIAPLEVLSAPNTTGLPDTSGNGVQETSEASVLAAPETDDLILTLTARRACWITSLVDGGQGMERLMPSDETIVLHAQDEAVLTVGDAGALSMLINNQPAKPLGSDGQVVTLRITRTNYPSYLIEEPARSSTTER